MEHSDTVEQLPNKFVLMAGSQWAKHALRLLFEGIDKISLESLMVCSFNQQEGLY